MPKYMHIYLLLSSLVFFFSLSGAICKPVPGSSDLTTEIQGKLDLGNHNVEQTALILARDYPGEYNINQMAAIYDAMRVGWYYYSDPSDRDVQKNANRTLQDGRSLELWERATVTTLQF
jgi:hypothetical protein